MNVRPTGVGVRVGIQQNGAATVSVRIEANTHRPVENRPVLLVIPDSIP
jgi:hypothetical protein